MKKFKLYDQLPRDPESIHAHTAALSKVTSVHEHKDLFDHLYECLSILDSKCSSLLTFNSIIIAVFAIFLTEPLGVIQWIVINFGMAMILASSLLLLSVVWIHWSTTDDLSELGNHAFILLTVRNRRTIKYRLSWYLAIAALTSLIAFLLLGFLNRVT